MITYKNTPGVWVEEISTLPPSVAQVATAIPAFIGYTEKGCGTVQRISSLLEYESIFGGPCLGNWEIKTGTNGQIIADVSTNDTSKKFLMYYGLCLYFNNGGGPCYIVSIGSYTTTEHKMKNFKDGLDNLRKYDEPTLIVMPDAISNFADNYADIANHALTQCHELGDRFLLLDTPYTDNTKFDKKDIDNFREIKVTDYLDYAAAYYPFLSTTINYQYHETSVTVSPENNNNTNPTQATSSDKNVTTVDTSKKSPPKESNPSQTLAELKSKNTKLYNQIKAELAKQTVTLPPSPAIAGVYAKVDRERGVWKAPANVSLASVIKPVIQISDEEQGLLNVDATSGKSINAIRDFTGKGTLVWGARTLDGNSNEWRYVPVRRLFITIEESVRKATAFAVFEPNDATTWLKVKAMIDSYLYGLWEQGALAGSKPEQAYFVHVGLGKTMTAQDILEGKMIVQIGIAAVRPAEFVILQFSHKLQQA